jgi:Ca2+-binding RTX toxin-like protein
VYEDGSGTEWLLRGGPTGEPPETPFGPLKITNNMELSDQFSPDRRIENGFAVTPEQRGNITLDLGGRTAEDVWNLLNQYAVSIGNKEYLYDPFTVTGYNSNTLPDPSGLNGVGFSGIDSIFSFDYTINGTDYNDLIQGRGGKQTFIGGAGNDTLIGGQDNDTLEGGTGNDILEGGDEFDTYIYTTGDGFDAIAVG